MTIRSGGHARDPRGKRPPQAHPYDPDAYATEPVHDPYEAARAPVGGGGPVGRGRRSRDGHGGVAGVIRFLLFAVVLGGLVLVVALTALRPLVDSAVVSYANDNPGALRISVIADIVKADIGDALTTPASTDPAQVEFTVMDGDTAATIGSRLASEGLLKDGRSFVVLATERDLTTALQQGTFLLRKNMTPDQMVTALLAPPEIPYVDIALRPGLRLEQITAKLETLDGLDMDPRDFYELVKDPPASLVADFPWLQKALQEAPEGASLEGFLWPGTYRVLPDTTPDELVRQMLTRFEGAVGADRMDVPADRGLSFYQVLTLASIVEREAVLDQEKPLIAGVYQNRIDKLPGIKNGLLNADPTVIYAVDTTKLDAMDFGAWKDYVFWTIPDGPFAGLDLPEALAGYNSYVQPGLPPGPIATPTVSSIDAALRPDTKDKYLYFLAIPDGGGAHVFAKTKKEHDKNRAEYGYQ